jgi:hypothetical protein
MSESDQVEQASSTGQEAQGARPAKGGRPQHKRGDTAELCAPCGTALRIGQQWLDTDPRITEEGRPPRIITIIALHPDQRRVSVRSTTGGQRTSQVSVDRLRPGSTGYRLINP